MTTESPWASQFELKDFGARVLTGAQKLAQTDENTRPETITELLFLFEGLRSEADEMWEAAARVLAARVRTRQTVHQALIRACASSELVQKALALDELGKGE